MKIACTITLAVLSVLLGGGTCNAQSPSDTTLSSTAACVPFVWHTQPGLPPEGSIQVPVMLDGHSLSLQLDTGANDSQLYGAVADHIVSSSNGARWTTTSSLSIGTTVVHHPRLRLNYAMKADAGEDGTLGLNALVGRITVIDFPKRLLCLFEAGDQPGWLAPTTWTDADLRSSKLFIPARIGPLHSTAFIFDTGSSAIPVLLSLDDWKTVTGKKSADQATTSFSATSWGTKMTIQGAPALGSVTLGSLTTAAPIVYILPGDASFSSWEGHPAGVIGNRAFLNKTVVLDLTDRVRFGILN